MQEAVVRLRRLYGTYLDQVCARTGHFDACVVMGNTRGYGPLGRLWNRFVGWVLDDYGTPYPSATETSSTPGVTYSVTWWP